MTAAYPLAAVQTLRAQEQEAAQRALASAIEHHEAARQATEVAEALRSKHVEQTRAIEQDEAARDAAGRSVAEALTARAYFARRKTELADLVRQVAARRAEEATRLSAIDAARTNLAQVRAEVEALAKHRATWQAEQDRVTERREEAELDDRAMRRS